MFGDYKIDLMKTNNSNTKQSKEYIKKCNLEQLITMPTRITTTTQTLIDHIPVNKKYMYATYGVIDVGISDHCLPYNSCKKVKGLAINVPRTATFISDCFFNCLSLLEPRKVHI